MFGNLFSCSPYSQNTCKKIFLSEKTEVFDMGSHVGRRATSARDSKKSADPELSIDKGKQDSEILLSSQEKANLQIWTFSECYFSDFGIIKQLVTIVIISNVVMLDII